MAWSSLTRIDDRRIMMVLQYTSFSLLYIPTSLSWYFGNLVVYLNSYWYIVHGIQTVKTQWVISSFCICWGVGFIIGGRLIKKIDDRLLLLLGIVVLNGGVFQGFFSVKCPVAFLALLGSMTGFGLGLLNTEVYTRIPRVNINRSGIGFAVAYSSMNIGGILFSWLATSYVNPYNAPADVTVSASFKVFKDKEVIERVPGMFLVLGCVSSVIHVLDFLLTVALGERGQEHRSDISGQTVSKEVTEGLPLTTSTHRAGPSSKGTSSEDLSPHQMIKTPTFYIMWFTFFANEASYVVLLTFFKMFGELWIDDDYFITKMGTVTLCCVIAMRMFWAVLVDKLVPKTTMIALTLASSLLYSFYYFTPQINRWLFAFWTCLQAVLCSSVYLNFSVMTLKAFGPTHFASNYGIMITGTVAFNLIAPEASAMLINSYGWFGLLITTASLNAIALMGNVLGLSNQR